MGMYYGLVNLSKAQSVSSYWKGSPPSSEEMKFIIKFFNWDEDNDLIYSSCYCDEYCWTKTDEWSKKSNNGIKSNAKMIIYNFPNKLFEEYEKTGVVEKASGELLKILEGADTTFFCN
jgi:hypothetical protein